MSPTTISTLMNWYCVTEMVSYHCHPKIDPAAFYVFYNAKIGLSPETQKIIKYPSALRFDPLDYFVLILSVTVLYARQIK